MTISVSRVDDTMPPIIGTAIRCITSAPVPWLHMIGRSPAMMVATVIIFRAHGLDGAGHDGGVEVGAREGGPQSLETAREWSPAPDRAASGARQSLGPGRDHMILIALFVYCNGAAQCGRWQRVLGKVFVREGAK